jgi:hypothetical protein
VDEPTKRRRGLGPIDGVDVDGVGSMVGGVLGMQDVMVKDVSVLDGTGVWWLVVYEWLNRPTFDSNGSQLSRVG